jgi:hypothetical protein
MLEQDFYKDFMQDIYARAGAEDDYREEIFTEVMCDFLVDQAVIESYDSVFFKKSYQGVRIDAWNFDRRRRELSLFICDYSTSSDLRRLTQAQVQTCFKRLENFFNKAKNPSFYMQLEEALPVFGVAQDIANNVKLISKLKLYLLSNGSLSERFKGLKESTIQGVNTVMDIWDISRLARIAESGKAKEDIILDFTEFVEGGIQYLPAFTDSKICKSYLLTIPGLMLSDIYSRYGERLLEQNVRTFLQFRGGVNKGIRNTLKNEPEMFFAYNNGLTVTAEDIKVEKGRMLTVKNLQIVNGGQTTASIFMSKLQDKLIALEKVYVQVKLSVIDDDKVDEVVPVISKCANTQNKVSSSDFFSNHPFHKRIEDFSRRILAPSSEGSLTETHWFYERARGQYANRQAKMTPSQKKKFLIQNPKRQMFTKTDLAKFENSLAQFPHYVSKGAQWNFGKFAEEISGKDSKTGLWDKNDLHFNELYFKQLISKAIIFKFLDKNIMKQSWYGGYKANIIAYTLSKLSQLIGVQGKFIDYIKIWKMQDLSVTMKTCLLNMAEKINETITDTDENVTQFCKKEECWKKVKRMFYELSDEVVFELVDAENMFEQKKDAKDYQKILKGIEAQTEVYNRGLEYWTALIGWANKSKFLSEREMSILSTTLRMMKVPPSEKQCEVILKVEHRAIAEGFFHNE